MPIAKPFFSYYTQLRRDKVDGTGITIQIVNIDDEDEEVGSSRRHESHHYYYFGDVRFVDKYGRDLAIGDLFKWETREELDIWINKQIYSSHQIYDSKLRFCFL